MTRPIDAAGIPRRDTLIQGAIEALQSADEALRNGLDVTADLLAAQAIIATLIEKHC